MTDEIQSYLETELPHTEHDARAELNKISQYRAQLIEYKNTARRKLVEAQAKYRHPQEKGITDFDRRIMLNDMTAEHQQSLDTATDQLELLADRRQDILNLHFDLPHQQQRIQSTTTL